MTDLSPSLLAEFRTVVGDPGLIWSPEELKTYECDGLTNYRVMPLAVLLPTSTEQVQGVVRLCHRERIPFVARGSGTGLSGGALPVKGGIVISLVSWALNNLLKEERGGGVRVRTYSAESSQPPPNPGEMKRVEGRVIEHEEK